MDRGSIRLHEAATGKEFKRLSARAPAYAIRFHPDGKSLAFSSLEGRTVQLWDIEADREQSSGALLALARGALADAPGASGAQAGSIAALAELLPEWQARFPRTGDSGVPRSLAHALRHPWMEHGGARRDPRGAG